ncbi:MAG: hypothetical protein FDX21_04410 [Chlorobium sp.]|nr:MAG: hypothetical protein FDX21_04410 [Chlorobium sp.]
MPEVTLCCIDTRFPNLGFSALLRSIKNIEFGEILFFTNNNFIIPDNKISKLRVIRIENISSVEEYSVFIVKKFGDYIKTSYCLIIQWDGFVIHPERWDHSFLNYDYIGAPWEKKEGQVVGNGGFSLRSKKLLTALRSEDIVPFHPEDDCICITHRKLLEEKWGINFSPIEIAVRFSFEFSNYNKQQFGFHGLSNFPDILSKKELSQFIGIMPRALFVNEYFIVFCKKIYASEDNDLIVQLSNKINLYLEDINSDEYKQKNINFFVEALINLHLYRGALRILLDEKYSARWKFKYLKIVIRQYFGLC